MIGRVIWFRLDKKFGFVELEGGNGEVFLHIFVLKMAGYVSVPAGTLLDVNVERHDGRQRVVKVLRVDTSTADPGEPLPVFRRNVSRGLAAGQEPARVAGS
jgi:CspA family cold shock protein